MQIYDFALAGIMYFISGVLIVMGRDLDTSDSRALPMIIAVCLILLATALILSRLKKKNESETYDFTGSAKGFVIILMLLVFALCANWFGFYVCMPFFLVAMMWHLGQRNKKVLILVPIITTAAVLFFFRILFQIPLPEGTIFNIFTLLGL